MTIIRSLLALPFYIVAILLLLGQFWGLGIIIMMMGSLISFADWGGRKRTAEANRVATEKEIQRLEQNLEKATDIIWSMNVKDLLMVDKSHLHHSLHPLINVRLRNHIDIMTPNELRKIQPYVSRFNTHLLPYIHSRLQP